MGRVYAFDPQGDERSGVDHRCYAAGKLIPGVFRVEFDAETDEGFAEVHAYFNIADGGPWEPIVDVENEEAVKASFRHYVYIGHKDRLDKDAIERTTFKHLPQAKAA